ncbi:MAG: TIGR01458 family HAD-type hydrolase [Sedimenticolaceae bacterium]
MRGLLIDIDGVVYQGGTLIPGSAETVAWLQREGIPHLFLTNTTSRPRAAIVEKLHGLGVDVSAQEILTPVIAANHWIGQRDLDPVALFVAAATATDFDVPGVLPAEAEQGAAAVVIGDLGEAWDFQTLNRAFRLLMDNSDAALIALGMTRYWRADDGLRLDVAPFVTALEQATGRQAVVLGKPSPDFFRQAADVCGLPCEQLVMVGDDIRVDVAGAQSAGIRGIQVRTGKFSPADLDGRVVPDAVLPRFADLRDWWNG